MSRNLCRTDCYYCAGQVVLDEPPRGITRKDCGAYMDHYEGMLVAHASCEDCKGKYLAWVTQPPKYRWRASANNERGFYDLSFRSSFNDEDNPEDWPTYSIEVVRIRRLLPICGECGNRYRNERDYIGNGKTCLHKRCSMSDDLPE